MACYYIVISSTRLSNGHLRSIKGVFRGPLSKSGSRNLDRRGEDGPLPVALEDLRANFYCQLCDKQYRKQHEFDNHINSYDHAHKQRLKELKQREFARNVASRSRRKDRKQERAARRQHELSKQHRQVQSAPGSGPMFRSTTVAVEGCCRGAPVRGTQVGPSQNNPWLLPVRGRKQVHRQKVAFSFSLPKKTLVRLESSVFCHTGQKGAPREDFTSSRQGLHKGLRTFSPPTVETGPSGGVNILDLESPGGPAEKHILSPRMSPVPSAVPLALLSPVSLSTLDPCSQPHGSSPCIAHQLRLPLPETAEDCSASVEDGLVPPGGNRAESKERSREDATAGSNTSREKPEKNCSFLMDSLSVSNAAVSMETKAPLSCPPGKVETTGRNPGQEFYSVRSCNGRTVLPWPCEMLLFTRTQPALSYSCNPLHFDFRACGGRQRVASQAMEDLSGTDSAPPGEHMEESSRSQIQLERSNTEQQGERDVYLQMQRPLRHSAPRGQRCDCRDQRQVRRRSRRRRRVHRKEEGIQESNLHPHRCEESTRTCVSPPALGQEDPLEPGGHVGQNCYSAAAPHSTQEPPLKRLHRSTGDQQEQRRKRQRCSRSFSSDSEMSSDETYQSSTARMWTSGSKRRKRRRKSPGPVAMDTCQAVSCSEETGREEHGAERLPVSSCPLDNSRLSGPTVGNPTQSIVRRDGGPLEAIGLPMSTQCNTENIRECLSAEIVDIRPLGDMQVGNKENDSEAEMRQGTATTEDFMSSVVDIHCCHCDTQEAIEHRSEPLNLKKPSKQSSPKQDRKDHMTAKLGPERQPGDGPFRASPLGGVRRRHVLHLYTNGLLLPRQRMLFPSKRKQLLPGPPVPFTPPMLNPASLAPPISSINILQHHATLLPPRTPLISQVFPLTRVHPAAPSFVPLVPTGSFPPIAAAFRTVAGPALLHPLLPPQAAVVPLQPLLRTPDALIASPDTFIVSRHYVPQVAPPVM